MQLLTCGEVSPVRRATGLALIVTLVLSIGGQALALDTAKLDQFFDRLAEKSQAMGSLLITKDGEVVYARAIGYGQINETEKKPLTAESRFAIASITKTYTAVMILQLVEEGKLKLTDTLDRFFPQVPNARKITLEQILTHRSGIPNIVIDREARRNATKPMSKDEMLALIVKGAPEFEPGSKSSYSNSGYFLLDRIVENVTGKPYGQALEQRISSKLTLKDTYMVSEHVDVTKNESLTYWRFGNDWKPGRVMHPVIFEIISTPRDMAKFADALFGLKLISQKSLDQMKTLRDGEGMGLITFTYAGKTFYGNTGGGDNYGSWLAYEPEEKLAVAYTTNAKVYPVKDIISGVVDIYYDKPFQIPDFETLAVSAEVLDQYVGVYSVAGAPKKWTVTRDGSALYVQPGQETAVAVEATADDKFQLFGGKVTFEFDASKKQMTLTRGPMKLVFSKEE